MPRALTLVAALFITTPTARAQDAIPPETVEAVKKASVFIRVEGEGWGGTGSGFVVAGDDKLLLIATNDHVAAAKPPSTKPGEKPATITVVFDSGTKAERSYTAQIAATDTERDLAVLRVSGVKDPPKPISYAELPKLTETMSVYSFGFPFGKALATSKGSPAITVGKASISSLRNGPDGELSVVQIDGNLNPGNSGGPVVDAKGRLVGVAVARIKDGQGIGLAVPAQELARMMQGRVGRVRVTSRKGSDGAVTMRVEADLLDPADKLRVAAAHYFLLAPKAKQPDADSLAKHPGSKKLELKIDQGVAVAEFTVPASDGSVLVQVIAGSAAEKAGAMSRVRSFSLAPPPKASDFAGKPLPGWKEYSPKDSTFVVWVPEKPEKQTDEERNATIDGQRMRVNTVTGKSADGLSYEAESILLPLAFAKVPRKELFDRFQTAIAKELGGRVTESKDAANGTLSGAEYLIEAGTNVTRVRIFAAGSRVYTVQVTGTADQVAGAEAEVILSSYRLPGSAGGAKEPGDTAVIPKGPGDTAVRPPGKEPTIIAGGNNPLFKDLAPEGGLLIGMEIGLGKFGKEDVIQAGRPIYRVGDKEVLGTQRGTNLTRVVTLKAKEGYAVGAITCKFGLNFDGCSFTFMKVVNGKLDPKDSYESAWVGYVGIKKPVKLGGDGTPIVGLVGKASDKQMFGLGPLFKGQEAFDPSGKK